MVNEKWHENVPVWGMIFLTQILIFKKDCFSNDQELFNKLFFEILNLHEMKKMTMKDRTSFILFLIHSFQSISNEIIRPSLLRLVSLPSWTFLVEGYREDIFESYPKLKKMWIAIEKLHAPILGEINKNPTKKKRLANKNSSPISNDFHFVPGSPIPIEYEKEYIFKLIETFKKHLENIDKDNLDYWTICYCERFVELLIDLLSQLPTRKFLNTLFKSLNIEVILKMSYLYSTSNGKLFKELVSLFLFYQNFEIDDFTGQALSNSEMLTNHYLQLQRAQSLAFKNFQPELYKFALTNISSIDEREAIIKWFSTLQEQKLNEFCFQMHFINNTEQFPRQFLLEILVSKFQKHVSQLDLINSKSLYPDEKLLWNNHVLPDSTFDGFESLALPKLNLQFLTFHDHFLRNFILFSLESAHEIRQDLEDAIKRMQPRYTHVGTTVLRGWARMALPISNIEVKQVLKPKVGESVPESVKAEIKYTLPLKGDKLRGEWDSLRIHDIVFIIQVKANIPDKGVEKNEKIKIQNGSDFPSQFGVVHVRGAQVLEILDEQEKIISDKDVDVVSSLDKNKARSTGNNRTLRVLLDPSQYTEDLKLKINHSLQTDSLQTDSIKTDSIKTDSIKTENLYRSFNILMRRNSKENNFKAVLETIRNLMNSNFVVPQWLTDVFLGYGDPNAATIVEKAKNIDFVDSFLSYEHLKECYPNKTILLTSQLSQSEKNLFKINFENEEKINVEAYWKKQIVSNHKSNSIRFTKTQIESIQNSMNKGLSLIVGPPGTGKTDVAVQIISNWYHNFPNERILLVTHSNNALNQLFEKIMALDIEERHLLRLGHGGDQLETEKDFSKPGRVNYMLQLRLDLLSKIEKLALAINHSSHVSYSVETAKSFFTIFVLSKWENFLYQVVQRRENKIPQNNSNSILSDSEFIQNTFPFTSYFSDFPQPLFTSENSLEQQMNKAQLFWKIIENLFIQLEECRPFEVLKSTYDRQNYILTKQARIIAMTCTHAALKRKDLIQIGFKFDNILMEESAQILEIETIIPILLQEQSLEAGPRLKRIVLIGDHHQLPPVIKNIAFQKFSNMDQSLFTRFIRLGVKHITLDAQGRSRPSLASLYSWKYKKIDNLKHVETEPIFQLANAGFAYDYQFVDVDDYQGTGETEPNPHFYQNLGEAEYVVATYMYMRMLGYPSHKISIITSYNGQKHLIRDIIKQRCSWNKSLGAPAKITTVDRFQGQQNDYILLSFVRTKTVGHIRDVRRLVVAMSRARLGLYIFGRREIFKECYEITPTFSQLLLRPNNLALVKGELFGSITRKSNDSINSELLFEVDDVIHMGTVVSPAYEINQNNESDSEDLEDSGESYHHPELEKDQMDEDEKDVVYHHHESEREQMDEDNNNDLK